MPWNFMNRQEHARGFSRALIASVLVLSISPTVAAETQASGLTPPDVAPVRSIYSGKVAPDLQAETFRHIEKLFPTRVVRRGEEVRPLPRYSKQLTDVIFESRGRTYDLFDYLSRNRVAGLLVLKDGQIALEDYELGNNASTRWLSMSVVKSISSTLVGMAIQDGHIKSINDPVTAYLPELKGSAYEGASIRDILHMASGVKWNETYTDPTSDRRKMLDLQIEQQPGTILKQMSQLPRAGAPGKVWNYSTGETHIVGALVRAAVGKPVADYLSERIWSKAGMESNATWWLESPAGLEVGGSGLSATLRDYGRFGLFFLNEGLVDGKQLLPRDWRRDATTPQQIDGKRIDYGYMWWLLGPDAGPIHDGAFEAIGIFGQYIYINPKENVVIVVQSSRSKPEGGEVIRDDDFFAGVVEALK